jgi:hypothetical protein
MKLMAAAVVVAGGLAAGAWARLVPQAAAEPPKIEAKSDKNEGKVPPPRPAEPGEGGAVAPDAAEQLLLQFFGQAQPPTTPPMKVDEQELVVGDLLAQIAAKQDAAKKPAAPTWEFKYYLPIGLIGLGTIEAAAAKYAPDGWEFAGSVRLTYLSDANRKRIDADDPSLLDLVGNKNKFPPGMDVLVFKRPAKPAAHAATAPQPGYAQAYRNLYSLRAQQALAGAADPAERAKRQQVRELEAQLAAIQKQLADLRDTHKKSVVLTHKELGTAADLDQVMTALVALTDARYGADGRKQRVTVIHGPVGPKDEPALRTVGLTITGDPDAVDWVVGIAEKLKPATGETAKPPLADKK